MNDQEKCTGCKEMRVIVSNDSYGQYCAKCEELNWLQDNDLPDWY